MKPRPGYHYIKCQGCGWYHWTNDPKRKCEPCCKGYGELYILEDRHEGQVEEGCEEQQGVA